MTDRYYVPVGRSVGRPRGGIYPSGCEVPAEDLAAFGPKTVAHMVKLGRLAPGGGIVLDAELPGRTGRITPSPWSRNPDELAGLDVDQLNVMVQEIDAAVDPFETADEAIDWLSQDYEDQAA